MKWIATQLKDIVDSNWTLDDIILILETQDLSKVGDSSERELFHDLLNTKFVQIDEVDIAVLYATTICSTIDSLSESDRSEVYRTASAAILSEKISLDDKEMYMESPQFYIQNKLTKYMEDYLPKIRAKFACLELLACWHQKDAIARLVSICPKYIGSQVFQQWVLYQQWTYRHSSNQEESQNASNNLNEVFKCIKGDRRKSRSRIYKYWKCSRRYQSLNDLIVAIRANHPGLAKKDIKTVLYLYNVPENLFDLVIDGADSPSNVALDVMVEQKDVFSHKAYKDFQSYISGLTKMHRDVVSDPFVFSFFDSPSEYPRSVAQTDIWAIFKSMKT